MDILIAVASKHGSTMQIAQTIADELDSLGMNAQVREVEETEDISEFDAVLLGSAVYYGKWMKEARQFAQDHKAALTAKPVWLFSSGPLGDRPPEPKDAPRDIAGIAGMTGARGHTIFVGSLDKEKLGFAEKLVVKGVKAPYGDFRDWRAVREWAGEVAQALQAAPAAAG
jgi:menaquinone-dependent protoporphyrinogen oxidase